MLHHDDKIIHHYLCLNSLHRILKCQKFVFASLFASLFAAFSAHASLPQSLLTASPHVTLSHSSSLTLPSATQATINAYSNSQILGFESVVPSATQATINLFEFFNKWKSQPQSPNNRRKNTECSDFSIRATGWFDAIALNFKTSRVVQVMVFSVCMPCFFGCALLREDNMRSYSWALKAFLGFMDGKAPQTILTDQNMCLKEAIAIEMPRTKHALCIWLIVAKFPSWFNAILGERYNESAIFLRAPFEDAAKPPHPDLFAQDLAASPPPRVALPHHASSTSPPSKHVSPPFSHPSFAPPPLQLSPTFAPAITPDWDPPTNGAVFGDTVQCANDAAA